MSFSQIIGHKPQIELLKRTIANKKIGNSYIFLGSEGIGKKLIAKNFAKAINCNNDGIDSCDLCIPCRKIDTNNHPDINFIEPEGNFIKISQIREIQKILTYKPYEGKFRVIIIDKAEYLHISAANCLLKTLEDTPSQTVFILISTSVRQILPTILSRSQKILFSPLLKEEIIENLIKVKKIEESSAKIIASLSEGSLAKAYNIDEKFLFNIRPKLIEKISEIKQLTLDELFKISEEIVKEFEDINQVLEFLKIWFRDLLIFNECKMESKIMNIDLIDKIKYYTHSFSRNTLFKNIKAINQAQNYITMNANKQLIVDSILIDFSS